MRFADLAVTCVSQETGCCSESRVIHADGHDCRPAKKLLPKWAIYTGRRRLHCCLDWRELVCVQNVFRQTRGEACPTVLGDKDFRDSDDDRRKSERKRKNKNTPRTVAAEKASAAEVIKKAEPSIVLITIRDKSGDELGLGRDFVINESGQIATNYHVIENAYTADATF